MARLIAKYPEARDIFVANGFPGLADDDVLNRLGPVLKLKTALKSKKNNMQVFVGLLEEKIAETGRYREMEGMVRDTIGHLNMLTLVPCPLKVPLQGALKQLMQRLRQEKGFSSELQY